MHAPGGKRALAGRAPEHATPIWKTREAAIRTGGDPMIYLTK